MPELALFGRFIVGVHAVFVGPGAHALRNIRNLRRLDGAIRNGNQAVASGGVKAKDHAVAEHAKRETALVAVAPRIVHAHNLAHIGRVNAAEARERIDDKLTLVY